MDPTQMGQEGIAGLHVPRVLFIEHAVPALAEEKAPCGAVAALVADLEHPVGQAAPRSLARFAATPRRGRGW